MDLSQPSASHTVGCYFEAGTHCFGSEPSRVVVASEPAAEGQCSSSSSAGIRCPEDQTGQAATALVHVAAVDIAVSCTTAGEAAVAGIVAWQAVGAGTTVGEAVGAGTSAVGEAAGIVVRTVVVFGLSVGLGIVANFTMRPFGS